MAPAATAAQRPSMPPKAQPPGMAAKANQQQQPPQRSASNNAPSAGTGTQLQQQQAVRGPPTLATPPNTFVALESLVKTILQQTGYVLNGPGRIEERRDTYQTNFNELYSRFQQLADRLEDEVCHAKQIVRGQYALHIEMRQQQQQRRKRQREEEEEAAAAAAELARKRQQQQRDLELQKERERVEQEAAEERRKQKQKEDKEQEAERQRLAKLVETQKKSSDVVMLDSPADTPQSAGGILGKATTGANNSSDIASAAARGIVKPAFPVVTPPAENNDNNNNNADGASSAADFDIDSLFGIPQGNTQSADDQSNVAPPLNTTSDAAFLDPSADVASLIPGIESYASMDPSQSGTTVPAATTAVATAPDVMDFSTPDVNGATEPLQTQMQTTNDASLVDAGTTNFDDDFMNFMNDTSGVDMDQATNDSFEDWFKDM